MLTTNITTQDFTNFSSTVAAQQEKPIQRRQIDLLADYYTARLSENETQLLTKYAEGLVASPTQPPRMPDPRVFMRRDLLGLVQDSYALGQAQGLDDIEEMLTKNPDFSSMVNTVEFALGDTPEQRLEKNIRALQRDIDKSRDINRTAQTLQKYQRTATALQKTASQIGTPQQQQQVQQITQQVQQLQQTATARAGLRLVNQNIGKAATQQQQAQSTVQQQIAATGSPNTEDYLVKRAIEEKLQYLETRRDSLQQTPPVVLDEDAEFFKWYSQKRLVPIANRYQLALENKNKEAKEILTKYTGDIGGQSTTKIQQGDITKRVVNKLLNIESQATPKPSDKIKRPIKRVQRVVATELAIAYNIGRLKAYLKAGIQYVTVSTSLYSPSPFPCAYCKDTEEKSQDNPISIASLLKNAYKNRGFDKNLNRPIEQRYLVHHPYCMCFYKPHPKRDPEDKQESGGVYTDPNSWKFILGAGLGVSLAFLAFALTTGRKISVPQTIPIPRLPSKLPTVKTTVIPRTIPIQAIRDQGMPPVVADRNVKLATVPSIPRVNPRTIRSDLRDPLSLRMFLNDLSKTVRKLNLTTQEQQDLENGLNQIARNPDLEFVDKALEAQLLIAKLRNPEYAKEVVDNAVRKSGFIKELYFRRFDKIANSFNKTISPQRTIDKLANRVETYVSKTEATNITNAVNNIEKTRIDKQLQPISLLRSDLQKSLERVSNKANKKEADLLYIQDLQSRIADLDNFTTILQQQKEQLANIRASIRVVNTPIINQQIARTQSIVERLATDPSVLQEAQQNYETLLEMLIVLTPKEAVKYNAIRNDLNRRIKNTQGIELKRFTGHMVGFSSMFNRKYSC